MFYKGAFFFNPSEKVFCSCFLLLAVFSFMAVVLLISTQRETCFFLDIDKEKLLQTKLSRFSRLFNNWKFTKTIIEWWTLEKVEKEKKWDRMWSNRRVEKKTTEKLIWYEESLKQRDCCNHENHCVQSTYKRVMLWFHKQIIMFCTTTNTWIISGFKALLLLCGFSVLNFFVQNYFQWVDGACLLLLLSDNAYFPNVQLKM